MHVSSGAPTKTKRWVPSPLNSYFQKKIGFPWYSPKGTSRVVWEPLQWQATLNLFWFHKPP